MRIHKIHPDPGEVRSPRSTCERCESPLTETCRLCWSCAFVVAAEMSVYDAGPADLDECAAEDD